MSILNLATPLVGVSLGVQMLSSGFESFLKVQALPAAANITLDFLTVHFGRTPRQLNHSLHARTECY
jgi:hypothetical protein